MNPLRHILANYVGYLLANPYSYIFMASIARVSSLSYLDVENGTFKSNAVPRLWYTCIMRVSNQFDKNPAVLKLHITCITVTK